MTIAEMIKRLKELEAENVELYRMTIKTRVLVGITFGLNGAALILAGIAYLT